MKISERYAEIERCLEGLAIYILCRPDGCQSKEPCPFTPACAADLTPNEQVKQIIAAFEAFKCCGNCKSLKWDHREGGDGVVRKFHMCGAVKHEEHVAIHDRCHFTPSRWKRKA